MSAPFEPAFPQVIDSTMRGAFASCPQLFFQEFIMQRALKGGNIHLSLGAAYAKGLEIVRNLCYGPQHLPIDQALIQAIPYAWAEFGRTDVPAGYEHKGPIWLAKAIIAYFDNYDPETDVIKPFIKKNGMPATEFTFSFPLQIMHPDTGEPILYGGRTDMVGVYNDSLWMVDDKTASSLGDSWNRSWDLRGQLVGYVFAARQFNLPAVGAIVRGTSFLKTGAFGFSQPILYKADWQLERWFIQLHRDVARMIQCWQDKAPEHPYGYWDYDLHDACNAFGGCPMRKLCSVSNPDEWWKTDYERRIWNPLELNPEVRPDQQPSLPEIAS